MRAPSMLLINWVSKATEAGVSVGNYAADANLKVATHHLTVDGNRCPPGCLTQKRAVLIGIVVVNKESLANVLPQFLTEVNAIKRPMSAEGGDESDIIFSDPSLLQLFQDIGYYLSYGGRSRHVIEDYDHLFSPLGQFPYGLAA